MRKTSKGRATTSTSTGDQQQQSQQEQKPRVVKLDKSGSSERGQPESSTPSPSGGTSSTSPTAEQVTYSPSASPTILHPSSSPEVSPESEAGPSTSIAGTTMVATTSDDTASMPSSAKDTKVS